MFLAGRRQASGGGVGRRTFAQSELGGGVLGFRRSCRGDSLSLEVLAERRKWIWARLSGERTAWHRSGENSAFEIGDQSTGVRGDG